MAISILLLLPVPVVAGSKSSPLDKELTNAIIMGDVQKGRELIDKGATVNPAAGIPPLSLAATARRIDMIVMLIEKGANVNGKGVMGMTALMLAADAAPAGAGSGGRQGAL